jgi:hypothetical protein
MSDREEVRLTWAEYRRAYAFWQRARNDAVAKAVEEAEKSVRHLEIISDRAYANYDRARGMFRTVFRKTENEQRN